MRERLYIAVVINIEPDKTHISVVVASCHEVVSAKDKSSSSYQHTSTIVTPSSSKVIHIIPFTIIEIVFGIVVVIFFLNIIVRSICL